MCLEDLVRIPINCRSTIVFLGKEAGSVDWSDGCHDNPGHATLEGEEVEILAHCPNSAILPNMEANQVMMLCVYLLHTISSSGYKDKPLYSLEDGAHCFIFCIQKNETVFGKRPLSMRSSHFWNNRPCIHLFSSLGFKQGSILRRTQPAKPPPPSSMRIKEPIRFSASLSSARDLRKFWNTYYTTNEWTVSYTDVDVMDMLQQERTTILGIRDSEGEIVATVASCPLPGIFFQQDKELQQNVFQVTCLVLHPQFRGKGLAGWLLNWLDYHTSRGEPVIHCWLRESHAKRLPKMKIVPFSQMRTAETTFLRLSQSPHPEKVESLSYSTVKELFHAIRSSDQYGFDLLYIPSESPHITWWKVDLSDIGSCAMVVGIADTKRVRLTERIYNVVFTCFVRIDKEGLLTSPFWYDEGSYCPYVQECVEAAAFAQGCDIVTVTNSSTCGEPFLKQWAGWKITERKRKLYMYNLNHSSFRNGSILFPV